MARVAAAAAQPLRARASPSRRLNGTRSRTADRDPSALDTRKDALAATNKGLRVARNPDARQGRTDPVTKPQTRRTRPAAAATAARPAQSDANRAGVAAKRVTATAVTKPRAPSRLDQPTAASRARAVNAKTLAKSGLETADNSNIASDDDEDELAQPAVTTFRRPVVPSKVPAAARPTAASQRRAKTAASTLPKRTIRTKPETQRKRGTTSNTGILKGKDVSAASNAAKRNTSSSKSTTAKKVGPKRNSDSGNPISKGPHKKNDAGGIEISLRNAAKPESTAKPARVTQQVAVPSSQHNAGKPPKDEVPNVTQQRAEIESKYATEPADEGERPVSRELNRSPAKRIALESLPKLEAHASTEEAGDDGLHSFVSRIARPALLSPARRVAPPSSNRPKRSPLLTLRDFASEDDDTQQISPLKKAPLKHHFGSLKPDFPEPTLHGSMDFLRSPAKKSVARSLFGPVDAHHDEPLVLKPSSPLKRSPKKVHIQKPPESGASPTKFSSSLMRSKLFQSPAKKFSINLFSKDILPTSDEPSTDGLDGPKDASPEPYSVPSVQHDIHADAAETESVNESNATENSKLFHIFSDGEEDNVREYLETVAQPASATTDAEHPYGHCDKDDEPLEVGAEEDASNDDHEAHDEQENAKSGSDHDSTTSYDAEINTAEDFPAEQGQQYVDDKSGSAESARANVEVETRDAEPSQNPDHEVDEEQQDPVNEEQQDPVIEASESPKDCDSPMVEQPSDDKSAEDDLKKSSNSANYDHDENKNTENEYAPETRSPASPVNPPQDDMTLRTSISVAGEETPAQSDDQQGTDIHQRSPRSSPVPTNFNSIRDRESFGHEDSDATEDELELSDDDETVVHIDPQSNKELDMTGLAHQLSEWHGDEVQEAEPVARPSSSVSDAVPAKRKLHARKRKSADPRMMTDMQMAMEEALTDDERCRSKMSRLSLPVMKEFPLHRRPTPRSSDVPQATPLFSKSTKLPTLNGSVERKRYQVTPVRGPFSPKPKDSTPTVHEDKENMHPYQLDTRPLRMSLTPVRRSTPGSPRVIHTVCKVPLREEDERVSLSVPRKRSRHLSLTPAKPVNLESRPLAAGGIRVPLKPCDDNKSLSEDPAAPVKEQSTPKRLRSKLPRRRSVVPEKPPILHDVVVYTDVHTAEGADASGIFIELLEKMGAKCVKSWNWNPRASMGGTVVDNVEIDSRNSRIGITHVVYKDGGVKTLEKVRQANGLVKCVGVAWVLDCEREGRQLSEDDYAVDISLIPRGGSKRRKSMEPRRLSNVKGKLVNFDGNSASSNRWDAMALSGDDNELPTLSPSPANLRRRRSSRRDSMEWVRMRKEAAKEQPAIAETPGSEQSAATDDRESEKESFSTPSQAYNINVAPSPFTPYNPAAFASKLAQQTCPPQQTHSRLFEDVSESDANPFQLRLEAARRKSLVWKPKIGSPLAR